MGLFSKLNRIAADARRAEEALYAMAAEEVANGDVKPGLWAKAFADSEGQESRAQATYLKLRVQQMNDELVAINRVMGRVRKEYGDDAVAAEPAGQSTELPTASPTDSASETPVQDLPPNQSTSTVWVVGVMLILAAVIAMVAHLNEVGTSYRSYGSTAVSKWASPDTAAPSTPSEQSTGVIAGSPPASTSAGAFSAPMAIFRTTESHLLIPDDTDALATIAGTLSIEQAESQHQLMLDGQRLDLPQSYFTFLSMTRYADQDIVLVSMNCGGTACTFLDLAFVRLYSNRPPVLETLPEFQFPSDIIERVQQGISLRDNTIDVALGLKDGVYWFASISPRAKLAMAAVSAPIEPLSADDCRLATEMLDYCTELKTPCAEAPFREFPSNCPDATMPLYRTTNYLASHTTGLNLPAFAQACKAASELSMAPSPTFIQSEICSGADPIQWVSGDAATASIEGTASAQ